MEAKRTPTSSKSVLSALRLLELGTGKSVSQISSEFELTSSDAVCVVMPFVRAGFVGHKAVTEDWRDDIYYSLNYEKEVSPSPAEDELKILKDDLAKSKCELSRLQADLGSKEASRGGAKRPESMENLHLEHGKTLSQIAMETGVSPEKALELVEPLVRSGDVVKKYVSHGPSIYMAAKKLRDFLPTTADDEAKKLKAEIKRLENLVDNKEEAISRRVKLEVLQSLDLGKGKSAGEIAVNTGMSIADVVGTMRAFVRSGLVEQSFTPQGFFYVPIAVSREPIPTTIEEKMPVEPVRPAEEVVTKQVARELVTPVEIRPGTQLPASGESGNRLELFDDVLHKLTVRELVLLREKINMELKKR
jgi:DNA-binding MarR family transcriptional regulator/predicted DNA-binding transcriptional regulator